MVNPTREPIIEPGPEWEAAKKAMLEAEAEHGCNVLANDWCASDLLHKIIDAVEGIRYADQKPVPIVDRPEA